MVDRSHVLMAWTEQVAQANTNAMPFSPRYLQQMVDVLPRYSIFCISGIGSSQLEANVAALLLILSPRNVRTIHPFSFGSQMLPPGGTVRLHAHDKAEEVLHVLEGKGTAVVAGQVYAMTAGTTLYLGHNQSHTFTYDSDQDLKWIWFFMHGGLEDFFEGIGKERRPGEATPENFARPESVKAIENATVFAKS